MTKAARRQIMRKNLEKARRAKARIARERRNGTSKTDGVLAELRVYRDKLEEAIAVLESL